MMDAGSPMVGKGRGERKEACLDDGCVGRADGGGKAVTLPLVLTYCLHGEFNTRRKGHLRVGYLNNISKIEWRARKDSNL